MNRNYKVGGFKWAVEIAQRQAIQEMFEHLHGILAPDADDIAEAENEEEQ